jgi:CheY-like chemotaxis protein
LTHNTILLAGLTLWVKLPNLMVPEMPDVLIFEDDPFIGNLASEILRGKGLTVVHYLSGAGVVQMVQEHKPKVVVLDIMMPGMDGLSACRAIRANPSTRHVKIVILTAKDSAQDKETAKRYGADMFLNKPFEPLQFDRSIGAMLGFPLAPKIAPPVPPVAMTLLPGAAILETASLWVIFDAGHGLRDWLQSQKQPPQDCWLLFSRYHKDTTYELNAGSSLLTAGCKLKVGGPDDPEGNLQRLAPRLCVTLPRGRVTPLLYPQREGEFQLMEGVQTRAQYAYHPGFTLAYRIDLYGKRVVYCPAHEIKPDPGAWQSHEMNKFRAFFAKADLLLHGYRRSLTDPELDDGLGRGAWEPVVDLAAEAKVQHLLLFPQPGAFQLRDLQLRVDKRIASKALSLRCTVARPVQRMLV